MQFGIAPAPLPAVTPAVQPLPPEASLREALAAMNARGLDALPVAEPRTGAFVGLISRDALLKAYERALAYEV